MARSKWKNPYIDTPFIFGDSNKNNQARATTILPSFIGKTFYVHNGRKSVSIRVTAFMIGHKFGEFVQTKKPCKYKK